MARSAELSTMQAQINALTAQLAQLGIFSPPTSIVNDEDRADYIAHGSIEHEALLGLVRSTGEQDEIGRICFESPSTGIRYMLEDEITSFMNYPNPREVALLVLRQKVNSIESGAVRVPDYAEPLHVPIE